MLRAELAGRLKIAMQVQGVRLESDESDDWINLPFDEAIKSFQAKQIMTKAAFEKLSDAYKRKSFTMAGKHSRYTLDFTKDAIDRAISDGTTRADFVKGMREHFDALGVTRRSKHHLETVFDTNVLGSYSHGRWEQQRDPDVIERRPFWIYRTAGDGRVRETHRAMEGAVYRADHDVWSSWYPPNGYRCRCRVEALTDPGDRPVRRAAPKIDPDEGFNHSPDSWLDE